MRFRQVGFDHPFNEAFEGIEISQEIPLQAALRDGRTDGLDGDPFVPTALLDRAERLVKRFDNRQDRMVDVFCAASRPSKLRLRSAILLCGAARPGRRSQRPTSRRDWDRARSPGEIASRKEASRKTASCTASLTYFRQVARRFEPLP